MIRQLLRYGLKGGVMTALNVCGMVLLVELVGVRPAIAAIVSTLALILVGYQLMNRLVFPDAVAPDSHARRLLSYYAVILGGKGVNYALFVALLAAGVWYPLAWLLGAGTVFLGTFSANRWVWHRKVVG